MSMTRAEAIAIVERVQHTEAKWPGTEDTLEALDLALTALRGPTREMVERMRGEWIGFRGEKVEIDEYGCPMDWAECSACGEYLTASEEYNCKRRFCPNCGAPMTDEAVDMMLERVRNIWTSE